jgi:hypothetical protein
MLLHLFPHLTEQLQSVPPRWQPLYSFTTENLSGYLPKVVRRGDVVGTICGSGDHALNAVLLGASRIVEFDINPLAMAWSSLKRSAVLSLTHSEFLSFFLRGSKDALSYRMFKRCVEHLGRHETQFFEGCYQSCDYKGAELRESALFNNRYDSSEVKLKSNLYLEESCFYELKVLLPHVPYTKQVSTAHSWAQAIRPNELDVILLSNIADYVGEELPSFYANTALPLCQKLRSGGRVVAAYFYQTGSAARRSAIDNAAFRESCFKSPGIGATEHYFPSVIPSFEDGIVLLQPNARK